MAKRIKEAIVSMDAEPFHFSKGLKTVLGVCVNIITGPSNERYTQRNWEYRRNNNNQDPHIPEAIDIMMNQRYW